MLGKLGTDRTFSTALRARNHPTLESHDTTSHPAMSMPGWRIVTTKEPSAMPKPINNNRLVSPRARFYLVIGTTALALLVLVYAVVFEHGSAKTFLESSPWLMLVLATLVVIFSGWRQAKDQRFRAGLLAKSIGKGLLLAGAVALLTKLPSPFVWSCFVLGIVSSAVGTAQFFSARRKAATTPPNEKEGGAHP